MKDFCKRTDIKPSTARRMEEKELIHPMRTHGGHRVFTEKDIRLAKACIDNKEFNRECDDFPLQTQMKHFAMKEVVHTVDQFASFGENDSYFLNIHRDYARKWINKFIETFTPYLPLDVLMSQIKEFEWWVCQWMQPNRRALKKLEDDQLIEIHFASISTRLQGIQKALIENASSGIRSKE